MCPLCLSTLAWIALGGGAGSGSLAALIVAVRGYKSKENAHERPSHCDV